MMRVKVKVYDRCKYDPQSEKVGEAFYNINFFKIISGSEAKKIEAESDGSCIDDYHEYLVLDLEDGDTATFRNNYVDLFRD